MIIAAAVIGSVVVAIQITSTGKQFTKSPAQSSTGSASAQSPGSGLKLSSASVPIKIPMTKAYENGDEIYLIATDASDAGLAS